MDILSLSTVDESKKILRKDNNNNILQDGDDQDEQSIWRRIISWIFNIFFPCKKKENP